jgi:hypothetical protein
VSGSVAVVVNRHHLEAVADMYFLSSPVNENAGIQNPQQTPCLKKKG